jgi:hypothetical protein
MQRALVLSYILTHSATILLLQTAPIGFVNIGWKYYMVIIIWTACFIPVFWYYFPETAQLSLEEISKNFGDDVAVHVNDATAEQREKLDAFLKKTDLTHLEGDEKFSGSEEHSVTHELKD